MMQRLKIGLAALVLATSAGSAAADLALTLAFDRSVAQPGETVTLSGSVTNLYELAVFAYMQVTVRLNGQVVSAFAGRMPLEPDETVSSVLAFDVPSLLPGGTVLVELNGRACDSNQTVSATLVLERATLAADDSALRNLSKNLMKGFGVGVEEIPVSVSPSTMGNIKRLYR